MQQPPESLHVVEQPHVPPVLLEAAGSDSTDYLVDVLIAAALDILQRERVELQQSPPPQEQRKAA